MRRAELAASARRIGPLHAVDAGGLPVLGEDFSGAGEIELSFDGEAFDAGAGTVHEIGDGYYYYQPHLSEVQAAIWIALKLDGVCEEFTFREDVETSPNGIFAAEPDPAKRRIGPLLALDEGGVELEEADLVDVDVEVTINGAPWTAGGGDLEFTDDGYLYYVATIPEVSARGWISVKIDGACEEFTFREDVVKALLPATPLTVQSGGDLSADDRVSGDAALTWSNTTGDADLSIVDSDLASDRGLMTAVVLSLFTDRRSEDDDQPPSGDARDRRGWWADQFAAVEGDRFGSRLWLLDRSKRSNETARRAEEYVREALAWMLEDRVVASIDVTVETTDNALLIAVGLQRPGRDPVSFRFAHTWDHLQEST